MSIDTAALVARFLDEKAASWAAGTWEQHEWVLRRLAAHAPELRAAAVISFCAVVETYTTRHGRPYRPASTRTVLLAVRNFLRWAVRRSWVLQDLGQLVPVRRVKNLPRPLGEDEAARLIDEGCAGRFAVRDRAMLEVFYGTGLRLSELSALDVHDVALGEGELLVRQGKGKKDRVVPFGDAVAAALRAWLRERPARGAALFLSSRCARLGVSMIRRIVRRAAARLRTHATPHRLRHSYATHLVRRGASVREVQVLLGHARIASTEVYLGLDLQDLARTLARSHPREKTKTIRPR